MRNKKRWLAILMSMAMTASTVSVPQVTVFASEADASAIVQNADAEVGEPALPEAALEKVVTDAQEVSVLAADAEVYPGTVNIGGGQVFVAAPLDEDTASTVAFTAEVLEDTEDKKVMAAGTYDLAWAVYPAGTNTADPNVTIDNGVVSVSKNFSTADKYAAYDVVATATLHGDKPVQSKVTLYVGNNNVSYAEKLDWAYTGRCEQHDLKQAVALQDISVVTLNMQFPTEPIKEEGNAANGHSTLHLMSEGGTVVGLQYNNGTIKAFTGYTGTTKKGGSLMYNQDTDLGAYTESATLVENYVAGTDLAVNFEIDKTTNKVKVSCGDKSVELPFAVTAEQFTGLIYGGYRQNTQVSVSDVIVSVPAADYLSISGDDSFAKISGKTVEREYTLTMNETAEGETFTWGIEGDNKTGLTIEDGKLSVADTAVAGTYKITAVSSKSADKKAEFTVTIGDFQQFTGAIDGLSTISKDGTATFTLKDMKDTYGDDVTELVPVAKWTSSNSNIVEINETTGAATAKAEGSVTITAEIDNGGVKTTLTKNVTVGNAFYLTGDVTADTTPVNLLSISTNDSVTGYQVTTSKDGKLVSQTVVDKADAGKTTSIDTKGADKYEIAPIYSYSGVLGDKSTGGHAFDIPEGTYNFKLTNHGGSRRDVYVNDQMLANNFMQDGGTPNYLWVNDIIVSGGSAVVSTTDYSSGTKAESLSTQVDIVKSPSILNRKQKVFVIGDSLVCIYYNGNNAANNFKTGWGQVLENYLSDDVEVVDLGNSGQTAEGLVPTAFTQVFTSAQAGDIVLFEAGYNDKNYSTVDKMKAAFTEAVEKCEAKSIVPIIVSPNASPHDYNNSVSWTSHIEDLVNEKNYNYIDLGDLSYTFLHDTYGDDTETIKKTYVVDDRLHATYDGANKWASIIAEELASKFNSANIVKGNYQFTFGDALGNNIVCQAKSGTLTVDNCTLSFELNGHGKAISPITVQKGTLSGVPAKPYEEGFLFMGWYKDEECTQAWDFATEKVDADTTIYAKWIENTAPEDALYYQDFTAVAAGADVATSTNAQDGVKILNDTDRGNYLTFDVAALNPGGNRGAYMDFDGLDVSEKDKYIVEFDAAITPGNNGVSQFAVKFSDFSYVSKNINYGANAGYALLLGNSKGGETTYTMNTYEKATIPSGEWCHYVVYIDKTKGLVSTTISNKETGDIANKVVTSYNGNGVLQGLYFLDGRTNGAQSVDNIYVRDVTDKDDFGTIPEEVLASVGFATEINQVIAAPAEGEPVHLPITVKATGSLNGDMTDKATVKWSVVGLENEDGYISLTKEPGTAEGTKGEDPGAATTAYFNVRNGVGNYYGYVQAEVTCGDTTKIIKTPFAVVNSAGASESQLAPAAGYPTNMNDYPESLVNYQATATSEVAGDVVLNGWSIYGSNGSRTADLIKEEDGTKAIKFASNGGGGSTVAVYQWKDQDGQYIVDFTAKVSGSASVGVYTKTPNNSGNGPEWTATLTGTGLTFGTKSIENLDASKYYRYVLSIDPSVKKASAVVYEQDGTTKVGEITDIDIEPETTVQKYFCFMGGWPIYLNSFAAYAPKVADMSVVSDKDVVSVPESGAEPATVDLSAVLTADDGTALTGAVEWSLAEEYANVALETTGAQTAKLTVSAGASGSVTVIAKSGEKQIEKVIKLTTSSDVVAFTKSVSSIKVPFANEEAVKAQFAAETHKGTGENLGSDGITYTLLGKDGATEAKLDGVTLSADGLLTVEPGAAAGIVYVKVQNKDGLVNKVKVNIHGLSFAFGSEVADGYTQVADTQYTDKLGYGLNSSSYVKVNADNVEAIEDVRFKAAVPNGNYVVKVDATLAADSTITSEVVESVPSVTGIAKSGSTFSVAVCDGILDLTFAKGSTIKTIEISQAPIKSALAKPKIYAIGDSTTSNTADGAKSWGNVAADGDVKLPDVFSGFSNNGMAGRDSVNFYNQARVEAVLLAMNPGDYVTINMGINSRETGEAASFSTLLSEYYVEAVRQRGGIPVVVTATPDGPVGNNLAGDYNSTTGKFTNNRGDGARNNELRAIAKAKEVALIELGQWGEDWMNTLTMDDVTKYNAEYKTEFKSVLEMVQSWYVDHNHYKQYLGIQIANYLFGELEKLEDTAVKDKVVSSIDIIDVNTELKAGEKVSFTAKATDGQGYTVTQEQWAMSGDEGAIKSTDEDPAAPVAGKRYFYTVTLTANEGYRFADGFKFTYNGTKKSNYDYQISSDGKSITIGGAFLQVKLADEDPTPKPPVEDDKLTDVPETAWYAEHVKYVYSRGYMVGKTVNSDGSRTFDPDSAISRAEFVQVLYSVAGKPEAKYDSTIFEDIAADQWYTSAVMWAYENNVVKGKGKVFDHASNMQRQELAVVLYSYAKNKGLDTTIDESAINWDSFTDYKDVSDWATDAMKWCVSKGLISGKGTESGPKSLAPIDKATRAECSVIVEKFVENVLNAKN